MYKVTGNCTLTVPNAINILLVLVGGGNAGGECLCFWWLRW